MRIVWDIYAFLFLFLFSFCIFLMNFVSKHHRIEFLLSLTYNFENEIALIFAVPKQQTHSRKKLSPMYNLVDEDQKRISVSELKFSSLYICHT